MPRTYIDYNRHAGDIDLELVEGGQWPYEYLPSGKARLGKALIWRTLDDGQPIYARRLGVEEIHRRIERYPPARTTTRWRSGSRRRTRGSAPAGTSTVIR